jgi:hypothetical protein
LLRNLIAGFLGRFGMVTAAAALLASPALAQLQREFERLGEKEARAALFGVDLQGHSPTYGFSWRECIQPDGETLYETPHEVLRGRLTITPGGEACFAYEDDQYSNMACFVAYRTANGLRFQTEGPAPIVFVITKIVTGVKSCKPQQLIG